MCAYTASLIRQCGLMCPRSCQKVLQSASIHMCPRTAIYVLRFSCQKGFHSACSDMCPRSYCYTCVLICSCQNQKLFPSACIYVSSYFSISSAFILLYTSKRPHTAMYVLRAYLSPYAPAKRCSLERANRQPSPYGQRMLTYADVC